MINSVVLENIGEISYYKSEFTKGMNLIKTKDNNALAFALGRITNNPLVCREFPTLLKNNSRITAEIEGIRFDSFKSTKISDDYFAQSREEDSFCFYANGVTDYSNRLQEYKDHEYYFRPNRLAKLTNGSCATHTFRAYLNGFIKNFKSQKLNSQKNFYINITAEGRFYPQDISGKGVYLSASEQTIFNFLCFLNVLEFWEGFGLIKDFNHPNKPLIITELLECIDKSVSSEPLLNRLRALNRQSFLIVGE